MAKTTPSCNANIPQHEIDKLARCLLSKIQEYFESEEGQKEFAEWKAKQSKVIG